MATGDRIYVADKATLDLVNTNVNSSLSKLDSVNSKLDSIESNSQSQPTQITNTQKFVSGANIYPASSVANVVNISGSGYLYLALVNNIVTSSTNPSPTGGMQVIVDGNVIINRSIATNTGSSVDSSGIIHSSYASPGTITFSNSIAHKIISSSSSSILGFNFSTVGVTVIPVPFRFNSSLRITLNNTNMATGVSYIYLLD